MTILRYVSLGLATLFCAFSLPANSAGDVRGDTPISPPFPESQSTPTAQTTTANTTPRVDANVVIVGCGISGLAAALDLGRAGKKVIVMDMSSVFGGHAVMAQGLMSLVNTPLQERENIKDSPDLAFDDYVAWGRDPDRAWLRYYVDHARDEIYDWLTALGVSFEGVTRLPGGSVPRGHTVRGRGISLVSPIYRACLEIPRIQFLWNLRADKLITEQDRIVGVAATELRTGQTRSFRAQAVVLATGGFQSNLDKVRSHWPAAESPVRLLAGGGINALGSGLEIAESAGAKLQHLDRQYNYLSGLPDPRYPGTSRGLFATVPGVWVNLDGKRFVAEGVGPKEGLPALQHQRGQTFWIIFGASGRNAFYISGSDWGDFRNIERSVLNNPALVKVANSLSELAAITGLPEPPLTETLTRYNAMLNAGHDDDFAAFDKTNTRLPHPIVGPPFYAAQFFPLSRKSLGGVAIDLQAHVLDRRGDLIPGVFAAGELTGLAGINGEFGTEGTFLAPSLLTGRVAARTILGELTPVALTTVFFRTPDQQPAESVHPSKNTSTRAENSACLQCHPLPALVMSPRAGYWHFAKVHTRVLTDVLSCNTCHAEIAIPFSAEMHRIDRAQQSYLCSKCHQGESK